MRHRNTTPSRKPRRLLGAAVAIIAAAGIAAGVTLYGKSPDPAAGLPVHLPATPDAYLGVYLNSFPKSYAPLTAFARHTKTRPDVAMYYSGWWVPFPAKFANTAASNGVVPLIQLDPDGIKLAGIAAGQNADQAYLSAYAEAVRAYHHPVILSFGHEMNGSWYQWGYRKTKPAVFVAAWRHIVTLFRVLGVRNVTWLWTVNVINDTQVGRIPSPDAWWPGSGYVNWVGIDGYYLKPSWQFAPLFGPTITDILRLTGGVPILIAETGAVSAAGQAGKIADLFAGVRKYNLLGFVWFDSINSKGQDFGITSSAAVAALHHGAKSLVRPG